MVNKNLHKRAKLIAANISGSKVMDFGSSEGDLHALLEFYFKNKITSVDFLGKPDIIADLNKCLPMNSNSVDTIIASEVIEHLDSPLNFLLECKRVIKKDGRIIITTPNSLSLAELQGFVVKENTLDYVGHLYGWNKKTFGRLAKRADLKVKKFQHISFMWRRNYPLRLITHLIPILRPNLFFVLTK